MDWEKLDWTALDRLREGFLSGSAAHGPYWRSLSDLEHYNLTFGERIGWKWDAALRELRLRGWIPLAGVERNLTLLDWGCGSGIAGRRVIEAFGSERLSTLLVWDHSSLAREYAARAARTQFPHLETREYRETDSVDVLVISHVLNELSSEARASLLGLVRRAGSVIWVEPGTHAVSRDLIGIREALRTEFSVVAPCTHVARCGLLAPENAGHWCHHFADPPPAIYADSDWVKFGQRAGIDLRSLPYSFLVLEKLAARGSGDPSTAARIIGDARHYKGYAKLLSCDAAGVQELTLQKRDDPALFKELKRESGIPIYRWTREADRIKAAQRVYENPENA